ncbi:LADA_0E01816g1_1 [Lachancea dasiensis]|uniref:LADA_0E01816g1_1 n=1 Tax=Lachancea dasiensis TaxID=1072105 RepID=A0A1G4JAU6_9SACH|nr:LADA_0E01816g1_1 [Lachancea dasiensis]
MVEVNHTIIGQFPYLNNTGVELVAPSRLWAPVVNYPYQILHSFYSAVVVQYSSQLTASIASETLHMGATAFVQTAGYFFSNYAVGCFVTALVLNRIISMVSLRSPSTHVLLPLWSRVFFHGLAIAAIFYNVWITLRPASSQDANWYFAFTYAVICSSHCVETFITVTSNSKPMEEFDYSIFELSMQFYSLSRSPSNRRDYVPDCLMALLGRLIIHLVEVTSKRHYRLLGSTIINVGHLIYLIATIFSQGSASIPLLVKYRHIPKSLALVCILVSLLCYGLALLVRWSPVGSSDPSDLQVHSFMQNWYSTLNCSGEEEFTSTLINLAILICNPGQTEKFGIHNELSQLSHQQEIDHSFLVSGYLSKRQHAIADAVATSHPQHPVWQKKLTAVWHLKEALKFRLRSLIGRDTNALKHMVDSEQVRKKNLNDLVTGANYQHFFTRAPSLESTHTPAGRADLKYVLPEDDWSADYVDDSDDDDDDDGDIYDTDCDVESDSEAQDNFHNVSNAEITPIHELAELLVFSDGYKGATDLPRDPQWMLSMWAILQCEEQRGKRLTRSQYSQLNETSVLQEVMLKRSLESGSSSSDLGRDLSCVVCKTNVRNIVLWPCKCFAICEECRVSLGLRGFKTCICCRVAVKGYSKINAV